MLGALLVMVDPFVRDLRPGTERKYRVKVVQEAGDEYSYHLRAKVVEAKEAESKKSELRLDLRLTDYRAQVGGQRVSAALVGGGQLVLNANGLPAELNVAGPQGPIWMPLLALYMPELEEDGPLAIPAFDLKGLTLAGKGNWQRPRLDLQTHLDYAGKKLGDLTFEITLDKKGWPEKAEGKLVSADGTYRFTLDRG